MKTFSSIMMGIGFLLMMGAAGSNDYYDSIGMCYPIREMVIRLFVGLVIFIIAFLIRSMYGEK